MNKEQFLKQLEVSLKKLSKEERQDILQDYEEYFAIGIDKGSSAAVKLGTEGRPKRRYTGPSSSAAAMVAFLVWL